MRLSRRAIFRLLRAGVIVGIAMWCSGIGLLRYYEQIRPLKPDVEAGRIYGFAHGDRVVYVSLADEVKAIGLMLGVLVAVVCGVRAERLRDDTWKPPEDLFKEMRER